MVGKRPQITYLCTDFIKEVKKLNNLWQIQEKLNKSSVQ